MHGARPPQSKVRSLVKSTSKSPPHKTLVSTSIHSFSTLLKQKPLQITTKNLKRRNKLRIHKLHKHPLSTQAAGTALTPEIHLTTPASLDGPTTPLPHDPEDGIPCNFIELPSTIRHPVTVKPWSTISFTDNLPKSSTFEQMQQQVNFYLENGGRVMKLYPGFEPYIFESIATQCQLRRISPDDLTLILPISAHEIKTGMYPTNHPVHPHFFSKQDKVNYIRENCPKYVPHRRGYFVHKIIQQLTSKIDGMNINKVLNVPIEYLYEDYPDNYDPREGGYIETKSKNIFRHNRDKNCTEIELADTSRIDPMDYLATQELPEGHLFKKSTYDGTTPISLPSGRYPADRLRDKVYQVTSHLSSETVDLVVINELEHAHNEHMQNVYDLVLESFFQCELLVLDGKTRGYGLSSRLLSVPYHHAHFLSPYKLTLISNFAAELARLFKGLPAKDPYFHPQQFRLLMDICSGAVLPPAAVVDDMYGDFKQQFMDKYSKPKQHDTATASTDQLSTQPTQEQEPQQENTPNKPQTLDDLYSSLKQSLESQGLKLAELTKDKEQVNKKVPTKGAPKMSDYFNGAFSSFKPITIDNTELQHKYSQNDSNSISISLPQGGKKHRKDGSTEQPQGTLNVSLNFLFEGTSGKNSPSDDTVMNTNLTAQQLPYTLTSMMDLPSAPIDSNSPTFQKLTPEQKLLKRQFETIGTQLNLVLQAKRLTMLAAGSTPQDRLLIQQKQQILLDNYMLLPDEAEITHPDVIDKLYDNDSKYTLIDVSGGERAKFKDLLAAKRVLALKGEGLNEKEIAQLKIAKEKIKNLLQDVGGESILMKDGRVDPNKLNIGLDQLDGVNMEDEAQLDAALDRYLQDELHFDAESRKALTDSTTRHKKIPQIQGTNADLTIQDEDDQSTNGSNGLKVKKMKHFAQSLDELYEQELFLDANLYDDSLDPSAQSTPTTTISSTSDIPLSSPHNHRKTTVTGHSIGLPADAAVIPNTNMRSSLSPKTKLQPIPKDQAEEILSSVHGANARLENAHYANLESKHAQEQEQAQDDTLRAQYTEENHTTHDIDEHGQILPHSSAKSIKDALALKTNFNNYKYYNPYAIISKDKLRSEVLEFQLMTSLSKLLPNDDVKALVKHATQHAQKVQTEIRLAASRRVAIMKLDLFFEKALLFKPRYLAQKEKNNGNEIDSELTPIEQLMLQVRPKMVLNWEQWKRGERKRQFNNEVSFALESEFSNIFQNIIYKTIVNTQPELFTSNTTADDEEDNDDAQNLASTDNIPKKKSTKPTTGELRMPKLKLGQLFKTDTMKQLFTVITGREPGTTSNLDDKLTDEQSAQIKQVYDKLNLAQQQELERIAMYIPLYSTTGILPLFPSSTLAKHHDTREGAVMDEMKQQLKTEQDYKTRREAEIDQEIDSDTTSHLSTLDQSIPTTNENVSKQRQKQIKKAKLAESFDPNYRSIVQQNALLTQDMTWYNDDYVPLWMCNKRQSRLLLVEPEVNLANYNFTTQRTHPFPTTKPQWKKYKTQQQFQLAPGEAASNDVTSSAKLSSKEKQQLYHIDTENMTLITPHQYAIQQGMLVLTQNTFDVTIDDKCIRLLDHKTVQPGMQQQLNDYLTHSLSFLRTIERSYPYQARDSLAKNLPPILSVSTAQLLQMELPYITTVPEVEQALYTRLLPQIQGAVNVLQNHEEFQQFASQLAVAGEKTKSAAEACLFGYNTPIVNTAERQLANLHSSLKIVEAISSQLLWISLGLGFDSVGVPQSTITGAPTTYLQHIMMKESAGGENPTGQHLTNQSMTIHQGHMPSNYYNDRDLSELTVLSREEALSILQTASLQIIPVLKKKLNELSQHLGATPYSRQTKVAVAATERLGLTQNKIREFHMIGSSGNGDAEVDQKLLETNPTYRHYQQELSISKELENLYKLNPFVPAELSFNPKYKLSSKSESHLLLLQYGNIHQLNYTKAAQH